MIGLDNSWDLPMVPHFRSKTNAIFMAIHYPHQPPSPPATLLFQSATLFLDVHSLGPHIWSVRHLCWSLLNLYVWYIASFQAQCLPCWISRRQIARNPRCPLICLPGNQKSCRQSPGMSTGLKPESNTPRKSVFFWNLIVYYYGEFYGVQYYYVGEIWMVTHNWCSDV